MGYLRGALEGFNKSPETHNLLGNCYVATSQLGDAEREFRAAAQLQPNYANAHHNLAHVLMRQQRYAEAGAAIQLALQADPNNAFLYLTQSTLASLAGNRHAALEACRQAIRLAPDNWLVNTCYMTMLNNVGAASILENDCRRKIAEKTNDARHYRWLGDALVLRNQVEPAQEAYLNALRLRPEDGVAEFHLAMLLLTAERFDEAEAHARKAVVLLEDCALARLCLAMAQFARNQVPESRKTIEEAIRVAPHFTFSYGMLAAVMREQGDMDASMTFARRGMAYQMTGTQLAVSLFQDPCWMTLPVDKNLMKWVGPNPRSRIFAASERNSAGKSAVAAREELARSPRSPDAMAKLARLLQQQGNHTEAEALARQALRYDAQHAGAHVTIGMVYLTRRDLANAEAWVHKAISLQPQHAEAHGCLSMLSEMQRKPDAADAAAQEAVRLDPENAELHAALARLQIKRGLFQAAEVSLREVTRLNPDHHASYFDHAAVLRKLGRQEEADRALEKCQRLNRAFLGKLSMTGEANAAIGSFWQAEQAFQYNVDHDIDVNYSQMRLALLHLLMNDRDRYCETCRAMLKHFGDATDPVSARQTAHACLLQPEIIGKLEQHQKLLEKASSGAQEMLLNRERALWTYRTGNWNATLKVCRDNLAVERDRIMWGYYEIHNRLIEAMALKQLGRTAEAEFAYCAACRLADSKAPFREVVPGPTWVDWAIFEVTRREAETTLGFSPNLPWRETARHAVEHVKKGELEAALAAYEEVCTAPGSDSACWQQVAVVHLLRDDREGHLKLCERMRERFGRSDVDFEQERLCKMCYLVPGVINAADLPIDRLSAAVANPQTSPGLMPWLRLARCVVALRTKDNALMLTDSEAIRAPDAKPSRAALAAALVINAVAHHRDGNTKTAEQRLSEAETLLKPNLPLDPNGKLDLARLVRDQRDWLDLAIAELLRREAGELFSSP